MKIAIKWGLILGAAVCVWTLVIHYLGFYTTRIQAGQYADIVALVLPIGAIYMALRERRRRQVAGLKMPQSLATGVVTGLVSVPITAAFLWWYHHYLNPQWNELLIAWRREKMVAGGSAPEQIEVAIRAMRDSATDQAQILGALIGTLLISLVISLIIGAFMRRPPSPAA